MPKADLIFRKPMMNAAGTLGFTPDSRAPVAWDQMGAFITNPVSLRPRSTTLHPVLLAYPGGFLLHSGLPNPGLGAALDTYGRRWAESQLPVIVHLMADRPEETRQMVQVLESCENVMAVELGFAPLLADDIVVFAVQAGRGELPLIVCLPPEQVLRVGPHAMREGAAAISLAPPRGRLVEGASTRTGRLFGPALFPVALETVHAAATAGLPIIGAGGVFSERQAEVMLAAGAIGVQLDAQLWLP